MLKFSGSSCLSRGPITRVRTLAPVQGGRLCVSVGQPAPSLPFLMRKDSRTSLWRNKGIPELSTLIWQGKIETGGQDTPLDSSLARSICTSPAKRALGSRRCLNAHSLSHASLPYGSSSPGEATSVSPPAIVKGFATREKLLLLRVRGNCADPAASGISSAGARVAVCMASPAVRPFLLFRSPGSPRVPTGAQALQARKQGAFLLLAVAPRQSPPRREGKEGKRGSTLGFFSLSDASEETARARRTGLPYPNKGSSRQGAAATPWLLKLW